MQKNAGKKWASRGVYVYLYESLNHVQITDELCNHWLKCNAEQNVSSPVLFCIYTIHLAYKSNVSALFMYSNVRCYVLFND